MKPSHTDMRPVPQMPLLIARYQTEAGPRWGSVTGASPARAADQIELAPIETDAMTTGALIAAVDAGAAHPSESSILVSAGQFLSPVTEEAQLICQGLNYGDHSTQSGVPVRKRNLIFLKASSSLSGAFAEVVRPEGVQLLDYEVEIGLVLRTAINGPTVVTDKNIGTYVAGIVLCNDISARDVMFGATFLQWFEGKSFRTFCPAGPVLYLLPPGQVAETLRNLEMKLWLNGELRQSALSETMIFKPAETLTHLTTLMNLRSGDMVLTGTPGGVIAQPNGEIMQILQAQLMSDQTRQSSLCAAFAPLAKFLEPGDVITASLRDVKMNRDLGGQHSVIAAPRKELSI